jgi:hypothetical protein
MRFKNRPHVQNLELVADTPDRKRRSAATSRHGETRRNRKIVEGENHLTRIKNVFQDSGERAYNAAIPFRGSGKCTWLLSLKTPTAPREASRSLCLEMDTLRRPG